MTQDQAPPAATSAGGAGYLRSAIIASICNDEGACIMCADCGHIFVASKPLSDESEPAVNTELAKALWYHMCALSRRPQREGRYRGR